MSQEEWDARYDAGEDPYSICADDLRRQGFTFDGEKAEKPAAERTRTARRQGEAARALRSRSAASVLAAGGKP